MTRAPRIKAVSKQDFGCRYSTVGFTGIKLMKATEFPEGILLERREEGETTQALLTGTCTKQSFGFRPAAVGSDLCHLRQNCPLQDLEPALEDHRGQPCRGQDHRCQKN